MRVVKLIIAARCTSSFYDPAILVWLGSEHIPVRGKHLDDLESIDRVYIAISKAATGPFVYFYFRFAYLEPNVPWSISELSFQNTVIALIALFFVYDFFYTILHWALHIKTVYGYVHKHHHRQKAPTRGNVDAVNVHPLEYFLGEYNHLFALFLCSRTFVKVHIVAALLFLAVGGIVAGINHTRFDIVLQVRGITIYDSKAHDVHHRIPQSNYGQYTMVWDKVVRELQVWIVYYRCTYNALSRSLLIAALFPTGRTTRTIA